MHIYLFERDRRKEKKDKYVQRRAPSSWVTLQMPALPGPNLGAEKSIQDFQEGGRVPSA